MAIISARLQAIRDDIRTAYLKAFRAITPDANLAATRTTYKDIDTVNFPMYLSFMSEAYLKDPAGRPNKRLVLNEMNKRFNALRPFFEFIREYPFYVAHTDLINAVLDDLEYNIQGKSDATETITRIQADLKDFADVTLDNLNDFGAHLGGNDTIELSDENRVWTHTDSFTSQPSDTPESKSHSLALRKLISRLSKEDVDEEVVRFILLPDLGSACIRSAFAKFDIDIPLVVNVLPKAYATAIAHSIMALRFEDDDDLEKDFSLPEQEREEQAYYEQVLRPAHFRHVSKEIPALTPRPRLTPLKKGERKSRKTPTPPPPEPSDKDDPLEGVGSLFEEDKDKGKGKEKETPTMEDPDAPAPDVPPIQGGSPSLMMKARFLTRLVREQAKDNLLHDHMKRFKVTSESPVPLSRNHVVADDFRINDGPSAIDPLYMITYSRKDRLPIFNPVTGAR